MAFYLAIDDATESDGGRNIGHLYERERFVGTLREAESELEKTLPPETRVPALGQSLASESLSRSEATGENSRIVLFHHEAWCHSCARRPRRQTLRLPGLIRSDVVRCVGGSLVDRSQPYRRPLRDPGRRCHPDRHRRVPIRMAILGSASSAASSWN